MIDVIFVREMREEPRRHRSKVHLAILISLNFFSSLCFCITFLALLADCIYTSSPGVRELASSFGFGLDSY